MEFLQTAEGCDDILFLAKFLGLSDKEFLFRKVLLEIVVAQFLVNLEMIIEFLNGILIALPKIGSHGSRHLADFLEIILEVAHLLEEAVCIVDITAHFDNLRDDFLLALIVLLLFGLDCSALLGLLLLDGRKEGLEGFLCLVGLRLECFRLIACLDECLTLGALLFVADGVELLFQTRHFLICDFCRLFLRKNFQRSQNLLLACLWLCGCRFFSNLSLSLDSNFFRRSDSGCLNVNCSGNSPRCLRFDSGIGNVCRISSRLCGAFVQGFIQCVGLH